MYVPTHRSLLCLLAAGLISNIATAAQPSGSKLGPHLIMSYTDPCHDFINARPQVIKILGCDGTMMTAVRDLKTLAPDAISVCRIYTTVGYNIGQDPAWAAQHFWTNVLAPPLNALSPADKALIDYVEGPNECDSTPCWGTVQNAQWLNSFWLTLTPLIANAGFRPCPFSIPVGNPSGSPSEVQAQLDAIVPALRQCKQYGGAWSYHSYTIPYTTDLNVEIWYSLRYRQYYDYFATNYPDLIDLPIILTEGGVDGQTGPAGAGWMGGGDAAKYQNWLAWFDARMREDAYVLGCTLFQTGSAGWESFNTDPISPWLVSHLNSIPYGPPDAPTGLTATPGNGQVALSWNASAGATSYDVKRSTVSGGPYTVIANDITTTSYTNTGLTNGTTYYYVVSAANSEGESPNSAEASATPQVPVPPVPTGLTATPGNGQIALAWNVSAGATSYNVKRSTASGGPYTTIASPTTNSYTNTGLTNGTVYYYVVSAVNAAGESANSSQVSATPTDAVVAEDFNSMPSWSSSYDASWGSAASWSIVGGGQAGNCLQASRPSPGSSSKVKVHSISAGANYQISVYIKCPSGSSYWAECAFKLGNYSAQDFDGNSGTWTLIQKFASDGANGNGNTWVQYTKTFASGSNTQLSVGYKSGSSIGTGPTIQWDTLRVTQLASVPMIALSPTSLAPSCTQGGNAAGQTFTVANSGTGVLNYSISDNVSWLSCSPASGTSTGEQDTITVTYSTSGLSAGTYYGTITVSDPNASNSPQTIAVTLTVNPAKLTVAEDFTSMPSWSSSYDAGWGSAANWSIVGGGQSGSALQASRPSPGSSSKVKVYDITANSSYTISVWIKCPSGSSYWAECAYKSGSHTAQNFDADSGSWTMIQKFASDGTNGNGDTWVQYSKTFNSGSNTQISVGFKLGSSSGAGPTVQWDTLRIQ
ncbi:MAG TPA: fibronectin type III domain-containing protein [Phycisphaerae bacterium]|nr:fibronectin type III domain-containing protein [Phycisphaerae bacterium]